MNNERMSYWMPPNQGFLPSTGCHSTGRVETFFQLPQNEWSCPNEYPGLPLHPKYHNVEWWKRPTLAGLGSLGAPGTLLAVGVLAGAAWWLYSQDGRR